MPPKVRGRKKGTKKPKAFTYGAKNNANHYGYLNFIQTQAHNLQVDALLREVNQAQAFTKRAVKEALDSVYDNSGPMQVDPKPRHPPAPAPPSERRMAHAVVNPFGGEAVLSFGQEIRRLAAQNDLMRRNRVARETPQDMEGITATLSRTAAPATVEAFKFMAQGPQHRRYATNLDDEYLKRYNDRRKQNSNAVPSQEAIAAEKQRLRGQRNADATNAAMAGSSYPKFNMMDTGNQFRPAGRDFKAPRITPGAEYGVAPSKGFESYFENRIPEKVVVA